MLQLLQPMLAALFGAGMAVFGLLHTIRQLPGPAIWHQVGQAAPHLLTVTLFLACVALAVGGVTVLLAGVRDTRRRLAQIRHVPWDRLPPAPGTPGPGSPTRNGREYAMTGRPVEPGYDDEEDEPWQ